MIRQPATGAGVVPVLDHRGAPIGWALWSPTSEIRLRLLDQDPGASIDDRWWHRRIATAVERRAAMLIDSNARRLIHGEADGCPSFICDQYDRWLVVQLMSAGLEQVRPRLLAALTDALRPEGILARNDVALRAKERLPLSVELVAGDVPREIEVVEHGVRFLAAPWDGQKTGAFLDQRENRILVGERARGRALDCFSYHGSFALHMARRAEHVVALDASALALARARLNCERNGIHNVELITASAFEFLTAADEQRRVFETIVLDPPAFAKTRAALPSAIRGYKDINMRAMRLLAPGGLLFTASCSFHLSKQDFLDMLRSAAADSGRTIALRMVLGQAVDHPELLTIPETGYLKAALLEAL